MMMMMAKIMTMRMMTKEGGNKNLSAESKSETGLETFAVADEGVVLGWIGGLPGAGGGLGDHQHDHDDIDDYDDDDEGSGVDGGLMIIRMISKIMMTRDDENIDYSYIADEGLFLESLSDEKYAEF